MVMSPEEWKASKATQKTLSPEEWKKQKEKGNKKPFDTTLSSAERVALAVDKSIGSLPQGAVDFLTGATSVTRGTANLVGNIAGVDKLGEKIAPSGMASKSSGYKTLGEIADPAVFAIPMAKAKSIAQFVGQSAMVGGASGFLRDPEEGGKRSTGAFIGAAEGAAGGVLLGAAMKAGARLFGKEWLPWKATPEERKAVTDDILKDVPEEHIDEVQKQLDADFVASQRYWESQERVRKQRTTSLDQVREQGLFEPADTKGAREKASSVMEEYFGKRGGAGIDEKLAQLEASKSPVNRAAANIIRDNIERAKTLHSPQGEHPQTQTGDYLEKLSGIKKENQIETAWAQREAQLAEQAKVDAERYKVLEEPDNFGKDVQMGSSKQKPGERTTYLPRGQAGGVSPRVLAPMAGAAVGAVANPEDPLAGAMIGAVVAYGGGKLAGKVYSKAAERLTKIMQDTRPEEIRQANSLISTTANAIREKELKAAQLTNRVKDLVPDTARREHISSAMEHPELVNTLSKEEKVAHSQLKSGFTEIGIRAKEAGVVSGLRENYITHIVDWDKSPTKLDEAIDFFLGKGDTLAGGQGKTTSKFGKARKYDTIEELNAALEGSGLKLKTKDAAEIYKIYASSMEKAIAGKNMIQKLKTMKLPDGAPLLHDLRKGGFAPRGWSTSMSPSLQGYAIHPEVAQVLKHMYSSSESSAIMEAATALNNFAKRTNVMGSFFHAASLGQALMSSGFKTFGKELVTGFKGTKEAVKAFQKGGMGDSADSWVKHGMILETPGDVDRQALSHLGAVVDHMAGKAGVTLPTEKALSAVENVTTKQIDKITWDYAHTGFKLMTAEKFLEKAKLDHPDVPEEELRKEIVNHVNNTFGGLNWTQIAAESSSKFVQMISSPNGREKLNLLFFALDWTTSTLKSFTSMFGKGSGLKGIAKPRYVADYARRYQMRSAMIYFTLMNGVNIATSGHPIWENKKDITRVEFPDGTSMQLSKHAMEPVHWMMHPEKTLANKLGFLPHAATTYWGEREYAFGPELEDKSMAGKAQRIGEMMLPFQAQAAMQAPEGEGLQRALLATAGLPVYGKTKEQAAQDKQVRNKRRQELRKKLYRDLHQ